MISSKIIHNKGLELSALMPCKMCLTPSSLPQAIQFSKNKTDLSRKNDVFEVSLKRKRDPAVADDDKDDEDEEDEAEENNDTTVVAMLDS